MIKQLFLSCLFIIASVSLFANMGNDKKPVTWDVSIEATGNNTFKIVAEASMIDGFHIWAMDAGGDGSLINTLLEIEGNSHKWVEPAWKTNQKPKSVEFDFIEGSVNYFERKVKFTRSFTSTEAKPVVQLMITYQSCNEAMCFPPVDETFKLQLP